MRQHNQHLAISVRPQPCDVRGERLAYSLVIIQNADLTANKLAYPYRYLVRLGARSTNFKDGPIGHQRIRRDVAYPALCLGLSQALSVICALGHAGIPAFPYVIVLVRLVPQTVLPLLFKHGREPWIVRPIGLDNDS